MELVPQVPEGSTSYHGINPTAADGTPVVPEALTYRLMASASLEVIASTSIPVNSTQIVIPGTANTIGARGKDRYLLVIATHDGGKTITAEHHYELTDLMGV